MMFSQIVLEHFQNPRNAGRLPEPAVRVEVSNPACGDVLSLFATFSDETVVEARFLARGCAATVAAGSMLTEMAVGKHRRELAELDAAALEAALGGLPPSSRHAAALAADALRSLLSSLESA